MKVMTKQIAELRLDIEFLETLIDRLESQRRFTLADAIAYAECYSIQQRRRYGIARICRCWRFSQSSANLEKQPLAATPPHTPREINHNTAKSDESGARTLQSTNAQELRQMVPGGHFGLDNLRQA